MAGSGKKPGIKDLSDLKSRLGLKKEGDDASGGEAEKPANPFAAPPSGNPFAPKPEEPEPPPGAASAGVPAGAAPAGVPTGAAPAGVPTGAASSGLSLDDDEDDEYEDDYEEEYEEEEEVYEESYDYEAPDVDLTNIQIASGVSLSSGSNKNAVILLVVGLVIAGATFVAGMMIESSSFDSKYAASQKAIATTLLERAQGSAEAWDAFYKESGELSPTWDDAKWAEFEKLANRSKDETGVAFKFQLDPSAVSNDIFRLAGDNNPLPPVNDYVAVSNVLGAQLSEHVAETKGDLDEIKLLASGKSLAPTQEEKPKEGEEGGEEDDEGDEEGGEDEGASDFNASDYYGVLFDPVVYNLDIRSGLPMKAVKKEDGTETVLPIIGVFGQIVEIRAVASGDKFYKKYDELRATAERQYLSIMDTVAPNLSKEYKSRKKKREKEIKGEEGARLYPDDVTFYSIRGDNTERRYARADELIFVPRTALAVPNAKNALQRYQARVERINGLMKKVEEAKAPMIDALSAHAK